MATSAIPARREAFTSCWWVTFCSSEDRRESGVGLVTLGSRVHPLLQGVREHLGLCGGQRVLVHVGHPAHAQGDQHHILEGYPGGVLEESPPLGVEDAIDRLGHEQAADEVVCGHHRGRGRNDLPVAVDARNAERPEDVEVGLDSPSGEVSRGPSRGIWRNGNRLAGQGRAGSKEDQGHREAAQERAAEKDREVDVDVHRGPRPGPRAGRDPDGDQDAATHWMNISPAKTRSMRAVFQSRWARKWAAASSGTVGPSSAVRFMARERPGTRRRGEDTRRHRCGRSPWRSPSERSGAGRGPGCRPRGRGRR